MTRRISLIAVCCSSEFFSSLVRSSTLRSRPGVGIAQLPRHRIEAIGECFQLVAGVDLDLLVELAGADALRAFLERADRAHHAACERQCPQRRKRHTREDQECGAHDRRVELFVDFRNRLLDEHVPAQRCDRRHRSQDRGACQVARHHRRFIGFRRRRGERGLHVRQLREIGSCAAPGRCPDRQ